MIRFNLSKRPSFIHTLTSTSRLFFIFIYIYQYFSTFSGINILVFFIKCSNCMRCCSAKLKKPFVHRIPRRNVWPLDPPGIGSCQNCYGILSCVVVIMPSATNCMYKRFKWALFTVHILNVSDWSILQRALFPIDAQFTEINQGIDCEFKFPKPYPCVNFRIYIYFPTFM